MGGYHDERFHISSEPFFLPAALEGEGEAGLRQNIFQLFGGVIGIKAPELYRASRRYQVSWQGENSRQDVAKRGRLEYGV
jgi:hypothetical protein